jgi:hypothetical protein
MYEKNLDVDMFSMEEFIHIVMLHPIEVCMKHSLMKGIPWEM